MNARITLLASWIAASAFAADDWTVESKYGNTRLRDLAVINATVEEAINLIIGKCVETRMDGHAPGVILGSDSDRQIHIVTNSILVLDALKVLAEQADLNFVIDEHAVILGREPNNNEASNNAVEGTQSRKPFPGSTPKQRIPGLNSNPSS